MNDSGLQKQFQEIGDLVHELESIADPATRTRMKELVQRLMGVHGAGLERMLNIVFQSGELGAQTIDELGRDPLVSSLLVLYGLHPESLPGRVERGLHEIGSKLNKMGASASLIAADDGNVRVRIRTEGHTCGSTGRTAQALVEEAVYNSAPDLKSIVFEETGGPAASGFIAMETLLAAPRPAVSVIRNEAAAVDRGASFSEGMD